MKCLQNFHMLLSVMLMIASGHIASALTIQHHRLQGSNRSTEIVGRRGFLSTGFIATVVASVPSISHAYGEFEPGAKARKKAAQESKATSGSSKSSSSSSGLSVSSDDLKGTLGSFSYTSTSSSSSGKK